MFGRSACESCFLRVIKEDRRTPFMTCQRSLIKECKELVLFRLLLTKCEGQETWEGWKSPSIGWQDMAGGAQATSTAFSVGAVCRSLPVLARESAIARLFAQTRHEKWGSANRLRRDALAQARRGSLPSNGDLA